MSINGFEEMLERHDLKKTRPRLSVLDILSKRQAATSQPDLEEVLGNEVDRVTLYRVLKTFEERGIIHKILDLNGTANYAMCGPACSAHSHYDEHVHFNCTACFRVYCLDHLAIPQLSMPHGFEAGTVNLIVYGICGDCSKKAATYKAGVD